MTQLKSDGGGIIYISDESIATIAGTAALETEGVLGFAGYMPGEAASKTIRRLMARAITMTITGSKIVINIALTGKLGVKLHDVAQEVQDKVKNAIETMTDLVVTEVNVSMDAVTTMKAPVKKRA